MPQACLGFVCYVILTVPSFLLWEWKWVKKFSDQEMYPSIMSLHMGSEKFFGNWRSFRGGGEILLLSENLENWKRQEKSGEKVENS